MIKGKLQRGGDTILLLGLSRENVSRLLDDQPILVSGDQLRAMGLPTDMQVLLIGGETEADMSTQLGGMPLQPEMAGQEYTQRPAGPLATSLCGAQENDPLTVATMMNVLGTCDPMALVVTKLGAGIYAIQGLENHGAVVRFKTALGAAVPVAQLRAMIKLLGPGEMTPTAKRQLESLIEQYDE